MEQASAAITVDSRFSGAVARCSSSCDADVAKLQARVDARVAGRSAAARVQVKQRDSRFDDVSVRQLWRKAISAANKSEQPGGTRWRVAWPWRGGAAHSNQGRPAKDGVRASMQSVKSRRQTGWHTWNAWGTDTLRNVRSGAMPLPMVYGPSRHQHHSTVYNNASLNPVVSGSGSLEGDCQSAPLHCHQNGLGGDGAGWLGHLLSKCWNIY